MSSSFVQSIKGATTNKGALLYSEHSSAMSWSASTTFTGLTTCVTASARLTRADNPAAAKRAARTSGTAETRFCAQRWRATSPRCVATTCRAATWTSGRREKKEYIYNSFKWNLYLGGGVNACSTVLVDPVLDTTFFFKQREHLQYLS